MADCTVDCDFVTSEVLVPESVEEACDPESSFSSDSTGVLETNSASECIEVIDAVCDSKRDRDGVGVADADGVADAEGDADGDGDDVNTEVVLELLPDVTTSGDEDGDSEMTSGPQDEGDGEGPTEMDSEGLSVEDSQADTVTGREADIVGTND